MISQLNVIKKIISLIFIIFFTGCTKSLPLAEVGHGVKLIKSEVWWSRDFGPKISGDFRSLAIADLNNDGKLDIVGGGSIPGSIFFWEGDGQGNWKRKQRFQIKADIRSMAAGDINNDGWIDIISSSMGDSKGVQTWINKNGFFEAVKPITEQEIYQGIRLVDINNDGNLDVVAANSSGVTRGGIKVWLGDGKGGFSFETGPTRKGIYRDVAAGDFNNDGNIDLVGAGWLAESGALRLWLGSGDGRWSESQVEKGSFWGVEVADVNKDGNMDIIAAANFEGVKIYYGDGKGGFPEKDVLASKGSFRMAKAIDIDKNGLMDIVATSNNNYGIVTWYQESNRKWVAKDEGLPVKGFYFDFVTKDFNEDGHIDIASSTFGEGISVWFGGKYTPTLPKRTKKKTLSKKIVRERIIIPEISTSVFFDSLSADLKPESKVILSKVAELLQKFKKSTVKLEGHAAPRKTVVSKKSSNSLALSLARAKAVANFLISSSIAEARIQVFANEDAGDNLTDKSVSYQMQRRVDITTSKTEEEYIYEKDNLQVDDKLDVASNKNGSSLDDEVRDPFEASGDIIPSVDYQSFKLINNVPMYKIGPRDILDISIWEGAEEKKFLLMVTPTGTISFSFIENFKISGLTAIEAEMQMIEKLKELIKTPRLKIGIKDKFAYTVSIFGAVRSLPRQPTGPGTYFLLGRERMTQFLSRAGGHMDNADLTHVQLTRNRKTFILNIFDALFKGALRQDVIIDNGDLIFIPSLQERKKSIVVIGEVTKPGMFTFKDKISLLEAIIHAGGPTFYGKTKDVVIVRGDVTKPEAIRVNFDDIIKKGDFRKNIPLENGDIVYIAKNIIGNMREFLTIMSPVLDMARLPMQVYSATAIPYWEGFPLYQQAVSPRTVISSPPPLPPGSAPFIIK